MEGGLEALYSILLVDDEKYVRKGLKTIIERYCSSFDSIYEAINGEEALEFILNNKVDVVVTDIRMPKMDGIGLMRELEKASRSYRFIILSGYDDFQYAKEAISLGARAYLLKPVKKEEFLEIMRKIELDIENEKKDVVRKEKYDSIINNFKEHELNYILANENLTEEETVNILKSMNIEVEGSGRILSVFMKKHTESSDYVWNSVFQVKSLAARYLAKNYPNAVSFCDMKQNLIVTCDKSFNSKEFIDYLYDKTSDNFICGISNEAFSLSNIRNMYMQALEAMKYRIVRPDSRIFYYRNVNINNGNSLPVEEVRKIAAVVGTDNAKGLMLMLEKLFDSSVIISCSVQYAEMLVEEIYNHVVLHFQKLVPQKVQTMGIEYEKLKNIYSFESIWDYYEVLKSFIFEINDYIRSLRETYRVGNEIDLAIEYIGKNYNRDITMATVANHVSLNYSYFSTLFSKQTGTSFADYLKKIRVEKAKGLLQESNHKIHEISRMVGFKHPKHFTRSFKEETGISPADYRSRII